MAIALLMLPIVIRSAEVVLLLVPRDLREAALALGRRGGGSSAGGPADRAARG